MVDVDFQKDQLQVAALTGSIDRSVQTRSTANVTTWGHLPEIYHSSGDISIFLSNTDIKPAILVKCFNMSTHKDSFLPGLGAVRRSAAFPAVWGLMQRPNGTKWPCFQLRDRTVTQSRRSKLYLSVNHRDKMTYVRAHCWRQVTLLSAQAQTLNQKVGSPSQNTL